MYKQWITNMLSIICVVSCQASALEDLVMPKGIKVPHPIATPSTQSKVKMISSKLIGKHVQPPRRMITSSKTQRRHSTIQITTNSYLADTVEIAAKLKQSGYRLYKKRTRQGEESWVYWLKTQTGEPLYKVEIHWLARSKNEANINVWSWDDTTQFDLSGKQNLVAIFGKPVNH